MFEFRKLCNEFEELSPLQRGVLLTESSVRTLAKLKLMDIPEIPPVETLAAFLIGSIVADGKLDEHEYLLIYPALRVIFGDDFDFESVKKQFESDPASDRLIQKYTKEMMTILSDVDESLQADIVRLCLCAVSVDGKISLREKNYIKRLCKA